MAGVAVVPEETEDDVTAIRPLLKEKSRFNFSDDGCDGPGCTCMDRLHVWTGAKDATGATGGVSPQPSRPEVSKSRDRVFCHARMSVTHVDVKTGKFQVRMLCQWAWRTASPKNDTEISYRGVPGIRVPGLQTQVQESRVWKDLNDTESSMKNRTIFWRGTSIFWMTGFKKYPVHEFPFDRHVICLNQIDFVWRVHRDDDTFYDSMKVAWLEVETSSVLAEWAPMSPMVLPLEEVDTATPFDNDRGLSVPGHNLSPFAYTSKFQIRLRIERVHGFYVRQIMVISTLITLSSCSPLAMPPTEDHMGDRLSVYGGGLLTLVAFKYGIMDHLPSVPYSTFTDDFLMGQILTVSACIFECLIVFRYTLVKTWIDELENFILIALCVFWSCWLSYTWFYKPDHRVKWCKVYNAQIDDFEKAQADIFPKLPRGFGEWSPTSKVS